MAKIPDFHGNTPIPACLVLLKCQRRNELPSFQFVFRCCPGSIRYAMLFAGGTPSHAFSRAAKRPALIHGHEP